MAWTDVIDPLGGSFYVERLTEQMEAEIETAVAKIDAAGGMYAAVESGLVQTLLGESACAFQDRIERGEETIVGVTAHQRDEEDFEVKPLKRPDRARMEAQIAKFQSFKAGRNQAEVRRALDELARAAAALPEAREVDGGQPAGRPAADDDDLLDAPEHGQSVARAPLGPST